MATHILYKPHPKRILKKIGKEIGPAPFPRALTDKQLHQMLQDCLDAGGKVAWLAEFNLGVPFTYLDRKIGETKASNRPQIRLVQKVVRRA
jgi:hypothetical protein